MVHRCCDEARAGRTRLLIVFVLCLRVHRHRLNRVSACTVETLRLNLLLGLAAHFLDGDGLGCLKQLIFTGYEGFDRWVIINVVIGDDLSFG